jgi:hypothetical protein
LAPPLAGFDLCVIEVSLCAFAALGDFGVAAKLVGALARMAAHSLFCNVTDPASASIGALAIDAYGHAGKLVGVFRLLVGVLGAAWGTGLTCFLGAPAAFGHFLFVFV